MVLDKQAFRIIGLTVGSVFLLMGLLAVPAWSQSQQFGDLTAGQCIAIINNSGNQYSPTIIQNCNQLLDDQNETDGGTTPEDGTTPNEEPTTGSTVVTTPGGDTVVISEGTPSALPKTGGPLMLTILFAVTAGAGLLTAVVRRRR